MRTPDRFVAVRAGIVNLYEYDDQVFELADGRLLLRGHNTSGKTKALELLLPFCLDGDISPHKLDPFAKNAKDMKWNLVGCIDGEQRIGYVWLEFARLGADGLEHVTAGIGMKANRGADRIQRWFFLLRGRRIRHDVSLRRGDYPLTKRELAELLEGPDELLDSPSAYRRRLNDIVYGFPSVAQYETMISLLLELRRPHLSKSLDAAQVGKLLTGSLPEVDHDLMRRLGEGLEQLDDLQAALHSRQAVREQVERFTSSSYRGYARAAIADRGDRLRSADTRFHSASSARREADATLEEAHEAARVASGALSDARERRDRAGGEREALLRSPEWASVDEIEQLGRTAALARVAARQAQDRADDASARLTADEADAIAAGAVADEARAVLARALVALAEDAEAAGFAGRHAAAASAFEDPARDPATVGALLRDEADRWRVLLDEHERLVDAVAAAEVKHEQARAAVDEAQAAVHAADARRGAADAQRDAESEALREAIEGWAAELLELQIEPPTLARTIDVALEAGSDGAPAPASAWHPVLTEQRDALLAEKTSLDAVRKELAREQEELAATRARLEEEQDELPPASYTRPAPRDGRAGAPLWQLVEFAPNVTDDDRAGVEAALEGAGLLDAWVLPGGAVLDRKTLDVVVEPTVPVAGATLGDVLVAVDDTRVGRSVVERILGSVALSDDASEGACAVGRSGRFRLGPAHGRYTKPAAEFIGAAARAERRRRRIAELGEQLAALAERDRKLARLLARLDERVVALCQEGERFPRTDALAHSRRALALAEQREREARRDLAERVEAAAAADERRTHARAVAVGHAEACGLPSDLDRAAVRARQVAVQRYDAGIDGVVQAATRCPEAAERLAKLEGRINEARGALNELVRAAHLADAQARRLEAEHSEREGALGRTGEEIRARMHELEALLARLGSEIGELEDADKAAAVDAEKRQGQAEQAQEALAAAGREREAALGAFRRLVKSDVFLVALGADTPTDVAEAGEWTLTRALEVLRAIPAKHLKVRSTIVDLDNSVQLRCAELDRALGQQAEMTVSTERDADGLVIVRVREGARTLTVPELVRRLDDEIAERERTLSAEQRRVFHDTLLEEIAEHLRERIERVTALVEDMNATLARCPTGSGKTVHLEWSPVDDGAGNLRSVTRLLRRSVATLGETERAPLIDFFRERIQRAREQTATAGGTAETGAAAHLRSAFDYRDWFLFTLHEVKDGQRARLTPKRHAVGSGGEQAVLVHMPLFAAAAALYGSSRDGSAPRLVMLDEALSGIDDETREKVLGVLVALDLDVVMTSHELWGTYRTVPALSIYQLYRENGVFGVATEHFLWDGESLRELEQATLL